MNPESPKKTTKKPRERVDLLLFSVVLLSNQKDKEKIFNSLQLDVGRMVELNTYISASFLQGIANIPAIFRANPIFENTKKPTRNMRVDL